MITLEQFDDRFREYAQLMRWHRPIGIYLLLWPTLWALWIAGNGQPARSVVVVFVLGVIFMRSAGCVANDIADRYIDLHVARTRTRPLTAGRVSVAEAVLVMSVLCLMALGLVLTQNLLTIQLSLIGFVLAITYPFMKRIHSLPQVHLGLAFGWGIPMAFAALTGKVPIVGWLLLLANVLWSVVYDTQYAMVDREDDRRIGVKSTALLFGRWDKRIIGILQVLLLYALIIVGGLAGRGIFYMSGIVVAAACALYQQYLIREREPEGCFAAFLNNHPFGFAIFCGLWLDYLPVH